MLRTCTRDRVGHPSQEVLGGLDRDGRERGTRPSLDGDSEVGRPRGIDLVRGLDTPCCEPASGAGLEWRSPDFRGHLGTVATRAERVEQTLDHDERSYRQRVSDGERVAVEGDREIRRLRFQRGSMVGSRSQSGLPA
jgi:hypothetical protein